ncbi:MAG: hypothetical protein ACRD8U_07110, partial [Pyrinomonadaceae bacterium]
MRRLLFTLGFVLFLLQGVTEIALAQSSYTLTASPSSVAPAGSISVGWTAPSGRPTTDWIGLYKVGDPNTSFLWWRYTQGAASGSFTLNAPTAAGTYEFRYLVNDGFTDVTRSNT